MVSASFLTSMVWQLLVRSQMSIEEGGLARKAVYICTEGEPPISRLMQIAGAHVVEYPHAFERGDPLEHILVEKVGNSLQPCFMACTVGCKDCPVRLRGKFPRNHFEPQKNTHTHLQ